MLKTLVIAEKPSAASDIANALSVDEHNNDYFENADYVITSAIGHLVEIYDPVSETVDHKKIKGFNKWSLDSLPMLPEQFELRPTKNGTQRVKLIQRLLKKADKVINACDAAREGELIFHYIASYLSIDKPVQRLWLQSMTPASIRKAFNALRDGKEMDHLRDAAVARREADWLVGINATCALTASNSKSGGFSRTNAGRVQTPTLALLVEREIQRRAHVPKPYWEQEVEFKAKSGNYNGRWIAKDAGTQRHRIWDEAQAKKVAEVLAKDNVTGIASDQSKERKAAAPSLFDLNGLQREANRVFSLSARNTLSVLQSLYDRHKLLTYPRTESRYLPNDYVQECVKVFDNFANSTNPVLAKVAPLAKAGVVKVGKKVFDDSKVTDHFAIIPTGEVVKGKLSDTEAKLYDLICRRFAATFMEPAIILETVRTTVIEEENFESRGSVMVSPGWYEATKPSLQSSELPALADGTEQVNVVSASSESKETKPPARYDEAKLLGAMQGAYKLVEEAELSKLLNESGGLGTPATRASIIEDLIRNEYVIRNKKELIPTPKAEELIAILKSMQAEELVSPELTGQWEKKLREIEQGNFTANAFLTEIRDLAKRICESARSYDLDKIDDDCLKVSSSCPKCKATVVQGPRKFSCIACDFFFWKKIAGRHFSIEEAALIISNGKIGPFDDFLSKKGVPFVATVSLGEKGKLELDFESDDEDIDVATATTIGKCPVADCDGNIIATPTAYRCSKALEDESKCGFRLGRTICQRLLVEEEVIVILEKGKSALLEKFISKRGRPFNAYLKLSEKGKLQFEFEPRAAKKGAKKADGEAKVEKVKENIDTKTLETIGTCPKCQSPVKEADNAYRCENNFNGGGCRLKIDKIICEREIKLGDALILLTDGKTPLIEDFTSSRGFPFKAHLKLASTGKVQFEFADKKGAKKKPAKKAAS